MVDLWKGSSCRGPLVIAHRGGAALAAENTIAALEAATAAGADAIETDVRLTRDGILVCVHDADLMRLCNDPRAIADLELPTLRRLLPGMMTLREALVASNPLGILLDVKLNDECGVARIIDQIQQADAGRRAIIGLRSLILISAARARTADIAILAFLDDPDAATAARAVGADWFRLWQGSVSAKRVDAVRKAGMRLAVMVGQPRVAPLPDYPPFPVGVVDSDGLAKIAAIAPDAILLDDPRLMTQGAVS
ncbi:cobalamin biosynthesis protein [Rhizobium sp. Root1203]|uniref:glycerophosphodiester phosphodiesterase n=1 Tax=Rhizobium sp. Root1203 TaxID=1736427 RepID=UPI00070DC07C|nr:glycerophosphodiester phosphodiesterase family protein [Rhizobium sp. Root1203]KQV17455.1 cobalamin biosynthesis protein [Rhizobium sp. Root1203]